VPKTDRTCADYKPPPVIDPKILEREPALSIVKRTAATKAKDLLVESRRGLDADNLVF
jgi:hypothetical protein